MSDSTIIAIMSTASAFVAVVIYQILQNKRNAALGEKIEGALHKGEQTLPVLAQTLGMPGFRGRGKVVMALNAMVRRGRVVVIPAPDRTPQLQKVQHIKYRLQG